MEACAAADFGKWAAGWCITGVLESFLTASHLGCDAVRSPPVYGGGGRGTLALRCEIGRLMLRHF